MLFCDDSNVFSNIYILKCQVGVPHTVAVDSNHSVILAVKIFCLRKRKLPSMKSKSLTSHHDEETSLSKYVKHYAIIANYPHDLKKIIQ